MKTIYIKALKKTTVTKKTILIEDVAEVQGEESYLVKKINKLEVLKIKEDKNKNYLISIIDIIKLIQINFKNISISNMGETDIIVYYTKKTKKENSIWTFLKVVFVCLTLFTGGAIAIMTFHTDAAVPDIFREVYRIFTGVTTNDPTILEVFYSIGIAVGIIVFFNHFTTVKITEDPTPIEVEMRLYERDVEDSIIESLLDEKEGNNEDES